MSLFDCCRAPEVVPDAELLAPGKDQGKDISRSIDDSEKIEVELCARTPKEQAQDTQRPLPDQAKGKAHSRGHGEKGKGKGKGKVKDDGRVPIRYEDGLPILDAQLPQFAGTYAWIREQNGREHRTARLTSCQLLQEAYKKGGYVVTLSGKKHKVMFKMLAEMKEQTQIIKVSASLPNLKPDPKHTTEFTYGGHPIDKAAELAADGRLCATVNAASAFHAGGGFTSGGRHALEEAFCTQSTLYPSLVQAVASARGTMPYIPVDGVILSPKVEVFRRGSNQGYMTQTEPVMLTAVVSMAMYNKNPKVSDAPVDAPSDNDAYEAGTMTKMTALAHAAAYAGADTLILPDLGCGVFGNDLSVVGRICGEALKPYCGYFKSVVFTGKPVFFDAATNALGIGRSSISASPASKATVALSDGCCICGRHLKSVGMDVTDLSLLLNGKTGRREGGLRFLHSGCGDALSEKFPGCTSMTLPDATASPLSFFRALDVDANGTLSKSEVWCAVAALCNGNPTIVEKEFEEKWKVWDQNGNGELSTDEAQAAMIPHEFFTWVGKCVSSQ